MSLATCRARAGPKPRPSHHASPETCASAPERKRKCSSASDRVSPFRTKLQPVLPTSPPARPKSDSTLRRSCRTTTSIETVVRAGANPSSGGGKRTRMPAPPNRNRRCRSDQRPNVRRAHAVLPPRGYTVSAETACSQTVELLQQATSDASSRRQVMPRRTRNDVATAPTSPHVLGHPERERTTRRFDEQAAKPIRLGVGSRALDSKR